MDQSIQFWGKPPPGSRGPRYPIAGSDLPDGGPRVNRARDTLYKYDAAEQLYVMGARPWTQNALHFQTVRVSGLALLKMMLHARGGGSIEVMGLLQGWVDGRALVVTDAFRLPVEGTETRVNAQDEANEYLVEYLKLCREQGRAENVVGWYHSHPGYGCWLSGIDVETQKLQQTFGDPFVALVVDPDRTVSADRVDIGAFRTYPDGYLPQHDRKEVISDAVGGSHEGHGGVEGGPGARVEGGGEGEGENKGKSEGEFDDGTEDAYEGEGDDEGEGEYDEGDDDEDEYDDENDDDETTAVDTIPLHKAADFGAHANRYYSLDIEFFKGALDAHLLGLLWNKYWAQTLAQNPLQANHEFETKLFLDMASKIHALSANIQHIHRSTQNMSGAVASKAVKDKDMDDTDAKEDTEAVQDANGLDFTQAGFVDLVGDYDKLGVGELGSALEDVQGDGFGIDFGGAGGAWGSVRNMSFEATGNEGDEISGSGDFGGGDFGGDDDDDDDDIGEEEFDVEADVGGDPGFADDADGMDGVDGIDDADAMDDVGNGNDNGEDNDGKDRDGTNETPVNWALVAERAKAKKLQREGRFMSMRQRMGMRANYLKADLMEETQ